MSGPEPDIHVCEKCNRRCEEREYVEDLDEYWCPSCLDARAEAAWERHQEHLMENGPGPTLLEQQIEARKLK